MSAVNKIFLAGVGAVAVTADAVSAGFDSLVAKGEKASKEYKASIEDVKGRVKATYEEKSAVKIEAVKERIDDVTETVAARTSGLFSVATSKDIDALNEKLDRVIEKVAA